MRKSFCFSVILTLILCAPALAYDWSTNPGDGSPENPYQISEPNHLIAIGSNPDLLDKNFILVNDIVFDPTNNPAHVFTQVLIAPYSGTYDSHTHVFVFTDTAFSGNFEGNNHVIHNLNVELFGMIDVEGVVSNLVLQNDNPIETASMVGLVWVNHGTIVSCQTQVNYHFITVWGNPCDYPSSFSSGLVGHNAGLIDACSANTTMTGHGSYNIGGLVGENIGVIRNSHASVDMNFDMICYAVAGGIGGLVGSNRNGEIIDCYSMGNVVALDPSFGNTQAGGLVGLAENSTITSSYSGCTVSGYLFAVFTNEYPYQTAAHGIGGLIGVNVSSNVTDCNYTGTSSRSGLIDYCSDSTITHCSSTANIGSGYSGGLIGRCYGSTVEQCVSDCNMINTDDSPDLPGVIGGLIGYCKNSEVNFCESSGVIDCGKSKVIDGMGGLVSTCYLSKISNCHSTCQLYGMVSVGGLVGICNNSARTISNCHAIGAVTGKSEVGGLVGRQETGDIFNCFSTGSVNGIAPEYSSPNIDKVGGLVGYNSGEISMCYATGSVSSNFQTTEMGGLVGLNEYSIKDCYSTGAVNAGNESVKIGGFAGYNNGNIRNCYSVGVVNTGINSVNVGGFGGNTWGFPYCYFLDTAGPDNGYGTPLDDPNMMVQANFVGWDFADDGTDGANNIWRMCVDGVDYPRLSWEFAVNGDFACGDGVDILDLQSLAEEWLTAADTSPATFNYACDGNGDEVIDLQDFAVLGNYW